MAWKKITHETKFVHVHDPLDDAQIIAENAMNEDERKEALEKYLKELRSKNP